MAQREIQLNLQLTPVFEFDGKTDQFVSYFKEFPNAMAVGESENDAENRLIHLVEAMWKDRPDELRKTLINIYANNTHVSGNIKIA